jgi:ribonuclease HI
MIEIYTDGACAGNPGKGAAAYVLLIDGKLEMEGVRAFRYTTNNRMEMLAILMALEELNSRSLTFSIKNEIIIHSDSNLVVSAFNSKWLENWKRSNWIKSDKKPVLNKDIWKLIDPLNQIIRPKYKWVKGHAGIEYNERCDELATGAITNAEMNNSFLIDEYYENENKFLKNDDLFFEQKDSEHKETKDKKPTSAPKIIKTEIPKELVHNNLIDFEIKNGKVEMKLTQSSFTTSELSILLEEIILINRLMYK